MIRICKATGPEVAVDNVTRGTDGKLWGYVIFGDGLVGLIRHNWDTSDGWLYEIIAPEGYKWNAGEVRHWNCYTLKSAKEDCKSGIYKSH